MNFRKINIKLFLVVFVILLQSVAFAQIKKVENIPFFDFQKFHLGYAISLNTMDFAIKPAYSVASPDSVKSIDLVRHAGFNINIVSNFRITNDIDVRILPGLVWGQRDLVYTIVDNTLPDPYNYSLKIESIFIETPFLVKYKSKRLNNHRPYVIAGINYRFDMLGKEIKPNEKRKNRPRKLNHNDVYYEIGAGVDFYLPYFKFATELKYSVGLTDVLYSDNSKLSSSLDGLTSRMLVLAFYFE